MFVFIQIDRTLVFPNGSLEINVTSQKDSGNFTCIASNAAGESTGRVEVVVTAVPHLANSTSRSRDPSSEPALSDILTSSKVSLPNNETRGADRRVSLVELTGNSALIRWSSQTPTSGVRMFQVQYNSSGDDTLVYRSVYSHILNSFLSVCVFSFALCGNYGDICKGLGENMLAFNAIFFASERICLCALHLKGKFLV